MNKETETIVQMWAEIQRLNERLKDQKRFYDALCKPTEPASCILTEEELAEINSFNTPKSKEDPDRIYVHYNPKDAPVMTVKLTDLPTEEHPDPMPFVFPEWLKSKGFDYRNGVGGPFSDLQGRSFSINGNRTLKYFNPHDVYICFNGLNIPRTTSEAETLFYFLGII